MSTRAAGLILLLSISAWPAGKGFDIKPIESYPNRQTNSDLTIAAVVYDSPEQQKAVFGKTPFVQFGILPVLLIMQNDGGKALKLDTMEISYVSPEQRRVEETPASEVQYLDTPNRPNFGGSPIPNPLPRRKQKSKLAQPEIEGYAFNAKMLPPNDKAHGFVYFQIGHRRGSKLYIRGLTDAASGKELLFFEIPLDGAAPSPAPAK